MDSLTDIFQRFLKKGHEHCEDSGHHIGNANSS